MLLWLQFFSLLLFAPGGGGWGDWRYGYASRSLLGLVSAMRR